MLPSARLVLEASTKPNRDTTLGPLTLELHGTSRKKEKASRAVDGHCILFYSILFFSILFYSIVVAAATLVTAYIDSRSNRTACLMAILRMRSQYHLQVWC